MASETTPLKISSLKVFDILDEDLLDHGENPNEQDETTFDQLVQKIREDGFDEPLTVVPSLIKPGKYLIFSGHHRRRAGRVAGMAAFPSVIKEGWNEDKVAMELVRRNQGRGTLNPEKFAKLVEKLRSKNYDTAIIQAQMGFTKKEAFEKLLGEVRRGMDPAQRKKLDAAAENIKSVDGLSSTIHNIFAEHGTDLKNHGFLVFNFSNKTHHHVPCDKQLHSFLTKLEDRCREENLKIDEVFKNLLRDTNTIPVSPNAKVIAVQRVAPVRVKPVNVKTQTPPA